MPYRMWWFLLSMLASGMPCHASIVCDGIDDFLTPSLALSSLVSASAGTMSVWIKPTGVGVSRASCAYGDAILNDGVPGGNYAGLFHTNISGTENVCGQNWDGDEDRVITTYTTDTWIHLAWVHGGGNLSLYKDGALVYSVPSGDTTDLTHGIRVCCNKEVERCYNGVITQVQTWNVALSANEVMALGLSRVVGGGVRGGTTTWPLDQCADGASADAVAFVERAGNGNALVGDNGANNTGLACAANAVLSAPWGAQ